MNEKTVFFKSVSERIKKLNCGKTFKIKDFGTVRAYRDPITRTRMFSISKVEVNGIYPGGNLELAQVKNLLAECIFTIND